MLRPIIAGLTAVAAAAGGLYVERNATVAAAADEMEKERADAAQKCFALEGELKKLQGVMQGQQQALEDKQGTVDALWDERERRIESETRRAADGIYAAPETFAVLHGLAAHARHNAEKLPLFYEEYDLNASKLHTIGALLGNLLAPSATKKGKSLQDVGPALGMFRADPLLSAVSLLVTAESKLQRAANGSSSSASINAESGLGENDDDDLPASTQELSETFGQLMQNFQRACASAVRTTNEGGRSADDLAAERQQHEDSSLGFLVDRVVPRVAASAHMMTTHEADLQMLHEERERLKREAVVSSWRLYTDEDVFAAINYVTRTHRDVVDAAARGERWARHDFVAPALRNLTVWAVGAEQYLAELQTRRVIANIARCTSHNFVQVNPDPEPKQ